HAHRREYDRLPIHRRRSEDMDPAMDCGDPAHERSEVRELRIRLPRGQLRHVEQSQRSTCRGTRQSEGRGHWQVALGDQIITKENTRVRSVDASVCKSTAAPPSRLSNVESVEPFYAIDTPGDWRDDGPLSTPRCSEGS